MRKLWAWWAWIFCVLAMHTAIADEPAYTGISLSTPYPAQAVHKSDETVLPLSVHNHNLGPQLVELSVASKPEGWKVDFIGGGQPVEMVYVGPDEARSLSLRIVPADGSDEGPHRILLRAKSREASFELPLSLRLSAEKAKSLELEVNLPTLKGSPKTDFNYDLTVDNRSERDVVVNLMAEAPEGFTTSFTPQFSSQEVTSLPVKAGESRDFSLSVTPPRDVQAGDYDVEVRVSAGGDSVSQHLTMTITGTPELALSTPSGRLSGNAYAGQETPIKLLIRNDGSAAAEDIKLSAFEPQNWDVTFEPERIERLEPDASAEVTARVKPADKSLAGDFMVTFRAEAPQARDSMEYRVTVMTSTLWGVVGIAVVAIALSLVAFAVFRFGRR